MEDGVCRVEDDQELLSGPAERNASINQEEFDFVEPPAEDFFCPVTFELLLNPHQTTCCGHHLSAKAVDRLQREGKPCPMCKETALVTTSDKYFKRKASAILIRCPHKASGCEWVGEVGGSKQHVDTCPKRPWNCQHCDFKSTFEAGTQHVEECTNYPVPCPNRCEVAVVSQVLPLSSDCQPQTQIRMIPRCDIEKHRAECPLEIVVCEFADVGCKVRTTRQELKCHMEESQQEHLLSATLLNLRLTRETITEKDRQIAEKDRLMAEMQKQLAEKDRQIADKDSEMIQALVQLQQEVIEKDHQIAEMRKQLDKNDRQIVAKDHKMAEKDLKITELEKKLAEKECQIAEKDRQLANIDESIAKKNSQMLEALIQLQQGALGFTGGILQYSHYIFTLKKFSECQNHGEDGDWYSDKFDVGTGEFKLQLNVETSQSRERHHIRIRLHCNDEQSKGKSFVLALQMLNQQGSHSHYLHQWESTMLFSYYQRICSSEHDYITFEELYRSDRNIQYLKDDCIKFVLWIKRK